MQKIKIILMTVIAIEIVILTIMTGIILGMNILF